MLSLMLAGCVKEDMSDCLPESNVTVMFRYPDRDGADRFKGKHNNVIISVYDLNDRLVYTRPIYRSELDAFQGDRLYLAEGSYRVICWGNLAEHSRSPHFYQGKLLSQSLVTLETFNDKETCDPLMYAPRSASFGRGLETGDRFVVNVPSEGTVNETIDFVSAHTAFKVVAKGLTDLDESGTNTAPVVEITQLPVGYDFEMNTQGGTEDYSKQSEFVTTSTTPESRAYFYTGNFNNDDPIMVKLYSGVTGQQLDGGTVYLPQYLTDQSIDLSSMLERSITVTLNFKNGHVVSITVSVLPWTGSEVGPIW